MSSRVAVLLRPDAGWVLSVYPTAGEAGGSFISSQRSPRTWVPGQPAADPDRARAEAARRARARLRRYCVANRLNRLGTLTYGPPFCTDPGQARADVGVFFRRLRAELKAPFPYAWVPEYHSDKQRLHLHFALGRYVKRQVIEDAWGHGFVHIKRLSDVGVGQGARGEARRAAGYLSKYVSKSFADQRITGRHRYDVAQGFTPQKMHLRGRSAREVLTAASTLMGGSLPLKVWHSDDTEDWQGPPAVWAQWA